MSSPQCSKVQREECVNVGGARRRIDIKARFNAAICAAEAALPFASALVLQSSGTRERQCCGGTALAE